jgi:hypothetical protein
MRQETKQCLKCRKFMVIQLCGEAALPGHMEGFWRCACGYKDYAGARKIEGDSEWLVRWKEVNRAI